MGTLPIFRHVWVLSKPAQRGGNSPKNPCDLVAKLSQAGGRRDHYEEGVAAVSPMGAHRITVPHCKETEWRDGVERSALPKALHNMEAQDVDTCTQGDSIPEGDTEDAHPQPHH